jgi:hypothetical protein
MTIADDLQITGYAAYFEPLLAASEYVHRGQELDTAANEARKARAPNAEQLARDAIENHVNAFLVDRRRQAASFSEAHRIGREVNTQYGCPLRHADGGGWIVECGVLALHSRIGASIAGVSRGRCSICGASDLGCLHVPGRVYDGVRCVRQVYEQDLREISYVPLPDDPRTYRMEAPVSDTEVVRARGRALLPGEVPMCTHCATCAGIPTAEDLDPALWDDELPDRRSQLGTGSD